MAVTLVAILDDYLGVARPYFEHIPGIQIDEYPNTILPSSPENVAALVERLKPYPIICSMRERTPFPAAVLSQLPNLKLLATTGLRNLGIDVACAREHGIVVAGTGGGRPLAHAKLPPLVEPGPSYDATTQQCFSLLLALSSRIPFDDAALKAAGGGGWHTGLGITLGRKTFACVGLGKLGSLAARTAVLGFGMKAIAWSANLTQEKADAAAEGAGLQKGSIRAVTREELFATADVVSVHYVLSDRSRGLIGKEELAMMKKTALLVNTSRGPIIDEDALLDCLNRGGIRGGGFDVFNVEPLPKDSPWRTTKWGEGGRSDVVLSPHMGYNVEERIFQMYAEQSDTVERYMRGENLPDLLK